MQAARQLASRREFLSGAVAAGIAPVLVTSRTASAAAESALLQLSPGVRVGTGTIRNADDAAARAVALAEEAGNRGTFAVGGLLVDNSGRIIAEAINAVIRNDRLSDPTAHVERQLVDWFAHRPYRGLRLSPRDVTIVSSLDPCAMCAGAILRSGMRVITVAEDNYAGVHENLEPRHMPPILKAKAHRDMLFFGVQGRRPRPNHVVPIFNSDVSADHVARSTDVFGASVKLVQQKVGGGRLEGEPGAFKPTERIRSNLRDVAAQLGPLVKLSKHRVNIHESGPAYRLMDLLAGDGSALVDENGTVIVAVGGAEGTSRARTSVLELIRAYTIIRRTMNDRFNVVLPHQRFCSIVKAAVPAEPSKALLELGATGSFLELPRPTHKLPVMCYLNRANLAGARKVVASLPRLYQDIGITVGGIGGS
jgi:cytosine deaminase